MIYCINIINDQISGQPDWISDRINQNRFQIRSDQINQIRFRIRSGFFQIRSDLICSEP